MRARTSTLAPVRRIARATARAAGVLAAALVAGALVAAPAQAGILAPEDAAELAQTLAEAQSEQGVCYGWQVSNNFALTPDIGSSLGPDVPIGAGVTGCKQGYVQLTGMIDYACGSCESEDSASVSIDTNIPNAPTVADLEALGLKAGDLTGDRDDTTLLNMVNALPLLVADRGIAPYVAYEPATEVPATDRATDKPGSDFLRESWLALVLFGVLVVAGPVFYLYKRRQQPTPPKQSTDVAASSP